MSFVASAPVSLWVHFQICFPPFLRIHLATKKWCFWYLKRNRLIDIYCIICHSSLTPQSVCNKESLDSQELSWLPRKRLAPPRPSPLASERGRRWRRRPSSLWIALPAVAPDYCLQRQPLVAWAGSTWPTLAPCTVSPHPPDQDTHRRFKSDEVTHTSCLVYSHTGNLESFITFPLTLLLVTLLWTVFHRFIDWFSIIQATSRAQVSQEKNFPCLKWAIHHSWHLGWKFSGRYCSVLNHITCYRKLLKNFTFISSVFGKLNATTSREG